MKQSAERKRGVLYKGSSLLSLLVLAGCSFPSFAQTTENGTAHLPEPTIEPTAEPQPEDLLKNPSEWGGHQSIYLQTMYNTVNEAEIFNSEDLVFLQEVVPIEGYDNKTLYLIYDYLFAENNRETHFFERIDGWGGIAGDQILLQGALPEKPTNIPEVMFFKLGVGSTLLKISYNPDSVVFRSEIFNEEVSFEGNPFEGIGPSNSFIGDPSITLENAYLEAIYVRQNDGTYKQYDINRAFSSIYLHSSEISLLDLKDSGISE